ncbi:MAG: MauE/DoxX family redox-associated membrane protein [Verrucomicrobiota bacterium]
MRQRLPIISLIARLVLAGVFVTAALPKIQDPVAFGQSIIAYRLIEGDLVGWTALALPWLELICAIGLLMPWLKRASAIWIAGLLLVFITLHASAWARGLDIDCGCFGESDGSGINYSLSILRNTALLAAVSYLIWLDFAQKSPLKLKT